MAVAAQLLPLAGLLQGSEDAVQGVLLRGPGVPGAVQRSIVTLYLHSVISHNCGREEMRLSRKDQGCWASSRAEWQVFVGRPLAPSFKGAEWTSHQHGPVPVLANALQ